MEWINTFKSKKGIFISVLFLLFLLSLIFYGKYSGLLLIFSLLVFGLISLLWKQRELRIIALVSIVLLSLLSIGINDLKYGIDFVGGTRIPILLEHPVDEETMSELLDIIKKRANTLGLMEMKVVAIGNTEINVEIPSSDQEQIEFIEEVLSYEGIYEGVVDGKVAITEEDILPGTVGEMPPSSLPPNTDWGVSFTINSEAAKYFAETVKGKTNYPLFMFLDRPHNAIIVISSDELLKNSPAEELTVDDLLDACEESLEYEVDDLDLYLLEDIDIESNMTPATNTTKAILSEDSPEWVVEYLESQGFIIQKVPSDEMSPFFSYYDYGLPSVNKWEAVGLLSSPTLSEGITQGEISTFYSISGPAQGQGAEKAKNIEENQKTIISILEGGAFPVQTSIGSKTVLPPQLGLEFLRLSFIAIALSLLVISVFIGLRYQKLKLIIPIIVISISELIILISILGSFTIDLAAMAGIIAAIGVGVDAQIVITDELLKKQALDLEAKLENAFTIIKTNVTVAIVAMIPLLFSEVEVIGFAVSTILGALLGFLITRPAYAAIVENIVEE